MICSRMRTHSRVGAGWPGHTIGHLVTLRCLGLVTLSGLATRGWTHVSLYVPLHTCVCVSMCACVRACLCAATIWGGYVYVPPPYGGGMYTCRHRYVSRLLPHAHWTTHFLCTLDWTCSLVVAEPAWQAAAACPPNGPAACLPFLPPPPPPPSWQANSKKRAAKAATERGSQAGRGGGPKGGRAGRGARHAQSAAEMGLDVVSRCNGWWVPGWGRSSLPHPPMQLTCALNPKSHLHCPEP